MLPTSLVTDDDNDGDVSCSVILFLRSSGGCYIINSYFRYNLPVCYLITVWYVQRCTVCATTHEKRRVQDDTCVLRSSGS